MSESKLLITGYNGRLGRAALARGGSADGALLGGRRPPAEAALAARWRRFDMEDRASFAPALSGVRTVLHLASATRSPSERVEVDSFAAWIEAAKAAGVQHFVHVSIIGVDRVPLKYYRLKAAADNLLANSGLPFTILRATQFHEFAAQLLQKMSLGPIVFAPEGFLMQPVSVERCAERLLEICTEQAANRILQLAGPEVLNAVTMARDLVRKRGGRRLVVRLPNWLFGGLGRALAAGGLTDVAAADMRSSRWSEWVAASG